MVSTKGRYAIRFMIDLAEQESERPVTLDDIAKRQGISKKYLELIVKILVKAKVVKGVSGKGGGYYLLRKPEECTIGEILELTEGEFATVACLQSQAEECPRKDGCKTLPMWIKYDKMVRDYFYGITLDDLINNRV